MRMHSRFTSVRTPMFAASSNPHTRRPQKPGVISPHNDTSATLCKCLLLVGASRALAYLRAHFAHNCPLDTDLTERTLAEYRNISTKYTHTHTHTKTSNAPTKANLQRGNDRRRLFNITPLMLGASVCVWQSARACECGRRVRVAILGSCRRRPEMPPLKLNTL